MGTTRCVAVAGEARFLRAGDCPPANLVAAAGSGTGLRKPSPATQLRIIRA